MCSALERCEGLAEEEFVSEEEEEYVPRARQQAPQPTDEHKEHKKEDNEVRGSAGKILSSDPHCHRAEHFCEGA
eukprot:756813-Hanusia_phi.AAC.2